MLIAGWSFTSACNLRCKHCYNASGLPGKDELTLEQAKMVADKLKRAGVVAVNFGGGECALREDFIELCEYIHGQGIKISYTTNGTVWEIIKDHLHLFHDVGVSIDFSDAKRHDEFRRVPGVFDKAVKCMKDLAANGVGTEMVTCLTKLNCGDDELERLYKLAIECKVEYWRLNRFRANGRGIDNKSCLALSKEDLKAAYSFLAKKMRPGCSVPEPIFRSAFGGSYYFPGDPSGRFAFRIQPNGEVSPSVFLKESGGNILNKSVEEIMGSPIFRAIRNRSPRGKCASCPSYFHCRGGDAGASFLAYGHFDGPDPLCWLEEGDEFAPASQMVGGNWNVHELYLCTVYLPLRDGGDA